VAYHRKAMPEPFGEAGSVLGDKTANRSTDVLAGRHTTGTLKHRINAAPQRQGLSLKLAAAWRRKPRLTSPSSSPSPWIPGSGVTRSATLPDPVALQPQRLPERQLQHLAPINPPGA
jgi:hypothetical protein